MLQSKDDADPGAAASCCGSRLFVDLASRLATVTSLFHLSEILGAEWTVKAMKKLDDHRAIHELVVRSGRNETSKF